MKTKTIGELLRSARQEHRISVEDLALRTRIRREYLVALEENRFDALPAATFVKGYLKTYAALMGMDEKPLLALLRRDFKESAAGKLIPREFLKPVLRRRQAWAPMTVVILLLAVTFLSLFGYVGWQWYSLQRPPRLIVEQPAESAFVAAQIEVKGQTVPDAVVTVNAQPAALHPDGSFATAVYVPREGIHILTIEATDRRGKTSVIQRAVHVRF